MLILCTEDISRADTSIWTSHNTLNGTNQLFPHSLIHSSTEFPIFINGTTLHLHAQGDNLAPLPYVHLVIGVLAKLYP